MGEAALIAMQRRRPLHHHLDGAKLRLETGDLDRKLGPFDQRRVPKPLDDRQLIVHSVDTFTTFATIAGAAVPTDRPIDGVDQSAFLRGQTERSAREGFPVFVADRMEAIKWRNYKIVFYEQQRDWWSPPTKLGVPRIYDLINDPKEEYGTTLAPNAWVGGPMMKIVAQFGESVKRHPLIAPGTPDPYRPPRRAA